jgi:hypothetical protein
MFSNNFTKKGIISIIIIIFISLFSLLFFNISYAQRGLSKSARAAGLDTSKQGASGVNKIIGNVIGAGLSMVGVVFFVLVVYGGLQWMTARGDSDQVQSGRNTIITASIGVVVVLSSYAITSFVLGSITGGKNITQNNNTSPGGGNLNNVGSGGECDDKPCSQTPACIFVTAKNNLVSEDDNDVVCVDLKNKATKTGGIRRNPLKVFCRNEYWNPEGEGGPQRAARRNTSCENYCKPIKNNQYQSTCTVRDPVEFTDYTD